MATSKPRNTNKPIAPKKAEEANAPYNFLSNYAGVSRAVFSTKYVVITFTNGAILAVSHAIPNIDDGFTVTTDDKGYVSR